jgi:hypothetical protein
MELNPRVHTYVLKRQVLRLMGAGFRIFEADSSRLVAYCDQKGFRLREDIRIYSDESKTREVLAIQARTIMDFSAAYDIYDTVERYKVGALRRKGFSSMVRDEWEVLDPSDRPIGVVHEDSLQLALIRRLLLSLIPQNYDMVMHDGRRVCDLKQNFNPITYNLTIDFSMDPTGTLDRRLDLAAGVLLAAIEGKQDG